MQIVRIQPFGLGVCRAEYYGYRLAFNVGCWLVFVFPIAENRR